MTRGPPNLAAALSLLLCAAAVALWARSHSTRDEVELSKRTLAGLWCDEDEWAATSGDGGLCFRWQRGGWDFETRQDIGPFSAYLPCDGRWHVNWMRWTGPAYGDGSFARAGRRTYAGFGVAVSEGYRPQSPAYAQRSWSLVVPWPAVAALLAVAPAKWAARAARHRRADRRRRRGACAACGYDLTGNVSGTCPECGTEQATAARRA